MIIEKELLNKLKDFGLNSYESKLWTALLSRGSSTAGELSDIANVPRSRSYDVLESLERKGFIIMQLGKPIKYTAVAPSDVIDCIKKKAHTEAAEKIDQIEKLKESQIIDELKSLHEEGINLINPLEISGSIKGENNINSHLELMFKKAQKSIVLTSSSKHLDKKSSIFIESFKEAKKRGVNTKLYIKNKQSKHIPELTKHTEILNSNAEGMLCVVDNKEILFMLTDETIHPSYEAAVWLNTNFFADTLTKMIHNSAK